MTHFINSRVSPLLFLLVAFILVDQSNLVCLTAYAHPPGDGVADIEETKEDRAEEMQQSLQGSTFNSPAPASKKRKADHLQGPMGFSIVTPARGHTIQNGLLLTENSRAKKLAIYVIHDFPLEKKNDPNTGSQKIQSLFADSNGQPIKIDFEGKVLNVHEFLQKLHPLQEKAYLLRKKPGWLKNQLYVGKVGITERNPDRTVEHRTSEHRSLCNSQSLNENGQNNRLYKALRECAKALDQIYQEVVVYNIHPTQIDITEAHLIEVLGGLETGGMNSNGGSRSSYAHFLSGLTSAERHELVNLRIVPSEKSLENEVDVETPFLHNVTLPVDLSGQVLNFDNDPMDDLPIIHQLSQPSSRQ